MKNIDVVVPCYNSEEFVAGFYNHIRSISKEVGLIFVDDKSTDGTSLLLAQLELGDAHVTVLTNECNLGPCASRIAGLKVSDADYIAFIDIDDLPDRSKFRVQLQAMKESGALWSYHQRRLDSGKVVGREVRSRRDLYVRRDIGLSSVMISSLIKEALYFDSGFRHAEDYIWWFRLIEKYGLPLFVPEITYQYYNNPNGLSKNKVKQALSVLRIYLNPGLSRVNRAFGCAFFLLYALRGVRGGG